MTSVVLNVESSLVEEVRDCIQGVVGQSLARELRFDVFDVSAEFEYTTRFLEERDLEEVNVAWTDLDSSTFGIAVKLWADLGSCWETVIEPYCEGLAMSISAVLATRVLMSIDGGEVPFGIYSHGTLKKEYVEEYRDEFLRRRWVPATSVRRVARR